MGSAEAWQIPSNRRFFHTRTYQDVEDERDDPGRHHAQHGLPPVPAAVDEHQTHVLEVAHGSGEELHQGVGQAVAGQHFDGILFDGGYAPVEGLETTERERERYTTRSVWEVVAS